MKWNFNKGLLLLAICAAPARAGVVHQKMEVMEGHFAAIDGALRSGLVDAAAPQHAKALQDLFEQLDHTPSSFSADPQWHAWLSESALASGRLAAAVDPAAADLTAARAELRKLSDLREQAHTHFRPGLLGRIERWLKKRKRKQNEKTTAPGLPAPSVDGAPAGVGAP